LPLGAPFCASKSYVPTNQNYNTLFIYFNNHKLPFISTVHDVVWLYEMKEGRKSYVVASATVMAPAPFPPGEN